MRAIHNYIASHLTLILLPATSREITNMADYLITNGTKLYFVDPSADTPAVTGLCVVSLSPASSTRNSIDITPLCETDIEQSAKGLLPAADMTFVINFDFESGTKKALVQYEGTGIVLQFAAGASDGTDAPAWDAENSAWTFPTTRSWFTFSGDISQIEWPEFQKDAVIQATVHVNVKTSFKPYYPKSES